MRHFRAVQSGLIASALFLFLWYTFLSRATVGSVSSHVVTEPKDRAAFIREAFVYGWRGYKKHAYPHDMLKPLSRTSLDDR